MRGIVGGGAGVSFLCAELFVCNTLVSTQHKEDRLRSRYYEKRWGGMKMDLRDIYTWFTEFTHFMLGFCAPYAVCRGEERSSLFEHFDCYFSGGEGFEGEWSGGGHVM